jgi:phosphoadenosine phosphosulfate reductase
MNLERLSAEEVLRYAVGRHHPRLVTACSFQKEESVLLDMLMSVEPNARVFMIDTGVLFQETYAFCGQLTKRYGIEVEVVDATSQGPEPWTARRCCSPAKVSALDRALQHVDAWITAIRREQAPLRANAPKGQFDERRRVWKYNPLADWSEDDVWNYIRTNDLPYHPLHDRGYGSIGCAPCTRPGTGREGRWAGTDKSECGLHV